MSWRCWAARALVGLLFAVGLLAGVAATEAQGDYTRRVIRSWEERLKTIDQLIMDEEYEQAQSEAELVTSEMVDRIAGWDNTGTALGSATVLRALAAVGAGDVDEGLWYWRMAQQFFPELQTFELTAYGELGETLSQHRFDPDEEAKKPEGEIVTPEEGGGTIVPPKIRKKKPPTYPEGRRLRRAEAVVAVRVIIDKQGEVLSPYIVRDGGELLMAYRALEAIRTWKFKPARLDGRPIAVYYTLTVNFALQSR